MPSLETILLGLALLLIISIVASKLSTRVSVPALVIFLFVGMLAGSEGIGGIYFDDPSAAQSLGVIALVFILFAGGLDTPITEMRRVVGRGVVLATAGVLITALVVALFVRLVLGFSVAEAFLVGAIIASTDAAAVFSIMGAQKISLKRDAVPLLELESGSNDPMAIFLTIGAIELILKPEMPVASLLLIFVQQLSIGTLMGFVIGYVTTKLINWLRLDADGLYPVFTVAAVLLGYAATALLGGSGFLAAYIMGLVLSGRTFVHKKSLLRFHDALSWLMQVTMFLVLGLLVFPSQLLSVAATGIFVAVVLIFVARPISVFIALMFSRYDIRDKLMISWVGLRGATPIVLATFPMLAGIPQSDTIFNIIFFVVLISVLLQGSTILTVARWLGVTEVLPFKPQYPFELVTHTDIRSELVEIPVPEGSNVINQQIASLGLPDASLIVLIARGQEIVVPNGNTIIEQDDTLLVLADKAALQRIRERLYAVVPAV